MDTEETLQDSEATTESQSDGPRETAAMAGGRAEGASRSTTQGGEDWVPRREGRTLPEEVFLLFFKQPWESRDEKPGPAGCASAVAAGVLLELAVRGKLQVQRDAFTVTPGPTGDATLDAVADRLRGMASLSTRQVLDRLARDRKLMQEWKARLDAEGVLSVTRRRRLGIFPTTETRLRSPTARGQLESRLRRALAGGGAPPAATVLLLGLIEAAGRLDALVPDQALAFNRKRIVGWVSGKDRLDYKMDPTMRQVNPAARTAVIDDLRNVMSGR